MKHITEKFHDSRSIADMIEESNVNEGLKDIFKKAKDMFKKAWQYLKGVVVNVGSYFLPVDADGNIEPAITPMTAGKAYKDGVINKASTFVKLGAAESKIVGFKSNSSDAAKLYGSGNSLAYWKTLVKENQEKIAATINEVKMQNEDPEAKYNVIC